MHTLENSVELPLYTPVTKLPLEVTDIMWESTGAVPCRKPCVSPSEMGLLTEPRVTPSPITVGLVWPFLLRDA